MSTRPPGPVGVTPPERPSAATPVGGAGAPGVDGREAGAARVGGVPFGIAGAPGGGVAAAGLRGGTLDLPSALRVFAEEIRGLAVERIGAARADAVPRPPAEVAGADVRSSAAVLVRWLRAVGVQAGIPAPQLERLVDAGRTRAETVAAGNALEPALRDVLARARDAALRALQQQPAARVGAAPSTAPGTAPSTAPTAASGGSAPAGIATAAGGLAAVARFAAAPGPVRDASAPQATPPPVREGGSAAPYRTTADGAARPRSVEPVGALRLLAEEVRSITVDRVGVARATALPPLPEAIGADPDAAGVALARWLRAAGALGGVPDAEWPATLQGGHARAEAALARGVLEPGVRDTLALVRDLVVRGLQGETDGRAPAGAVPAAPGDPALRAEFALPALIAGGTAGARSPATRAERARDRVESIGEDEARRRDGRDDASVADDGPAPFGGRGEHEGSAGHEARALDLQGPMDCIRRYFEAFQAGDSAGYAALWVYPACVWSGGRWRAYPDAAACAAGNDEYARAARAEGMATGRIVMLRVEPLSADAAVVHGVFTRERADGRVIAETEAAYTTVRTAEGWRVAACVVK